jgi:glycosyltransferase involved in cell wall biosynthesis
MSKSPIDKIQSISISQETAIVEDMNQYPPFSIAMSVYMKDNAAFFDSALASVINQSLKPSEIVLVVDGPVHDNIQKVIVKYSDICIENGIRLIVNKIDVNCGLGKSLRIAVEIAAYDMIARMDSDDIASFNRFEKQLLCFQEHPEISVVGGQIYEFIENIDCIVGIRKCPTTDDEIKRYLKKRCPFNHMSVMFKKEHVLRAGNYVDWKFNEDYFLWIRMSLIGYKFYNLPENLVYVRVGNEMYSRRGGNTYFRSEVKLQRYLFQNNIIKLPLFILNVSIRFIVQIILSNKIRGYVFQKFFRE